MSSAGPWTRRTEALGGSGASMAIGWSELVLNSVPSKKTPSRTCSAVGSAQVEPSTPEQNRGAGGAEAEMVTAAKALGKEYLG